MIGSALLLMMFTRLRATQALPCSRTEFAAMSSPQAERALFAASKVEASFIELREHVTQVPGPVRQSHSSRNTSTGSWRVLAFISDRFLLSVNNKAVIIWDSSTLVSSSPAVAPTPWARFTLSNFLGYAVCYSTLYIAIAGGHGGHRRSVISDTCR